jgi:CoA:oxalate CoA-transferase
MTGPLEGIRVLDLTQVLFGPFATMLLSDMGAEVIKVERPEAGDIARGNGPFLNGASTYFQSLNRGKKSITIDLRQKQGVDLFFKLTRQVDILVENFTPKTVENILKLLNITLILFTLPVPVLDCMDRIKTNRHSM